MSAERQGAEVLLHVGRISVHYGGTRALENVSVDVRRGEAVAVIGANGAGKSSLLNAIVGVVPATASELMYAGASILGMPPEALVAEGISLVPERRELFAGMSVHDNLMLGAYRRRGDASSSLAKVYDTFPRLRERKTQTAGTMSGGEQQMLAIGRALMARPTLLLLDEPSLGLAPLIVKTIFTVLDQLRADGMTILLVEQNSRIALKFAQFGYVLEAGSCVMAAPASELTANDRVRAAYLGE